MNTTSEENRIIIADTTLRDGEQAPGYHMNPAQKLDMAHQLHRLGVDVIEAGFPASSPADFEAVQKIASSVGRGEMAPEIGALTRSVLKEIDRTWEALAPASRGRIHAFLSTSDHHLKHKLRMSREQALETAVAAVRRAATYTPFVQFSPEDASRSDRDYLAQVIQAVIEAGATTINITDTVGYAVPEEFAALISFLRSKVQNAGKAVFSVHCHNDLGLAVANSLAAVSAGATQVECTVNGIGERAGNCSLEELVMAFKVRKDHFGRMTRVVEKEIFPSSALLADITGVPVPPNKPVVGRNAFSHASGVHQDGVLKSRETYEIMKAEDIGRRGSEIILTARSGKKALLHRLLRLGVHLEEGRLEFLFRRFKEFADSKPYVTDQDIRELVQSIS